MLGVSEVYHTSATNAYDNTLLLLFFTSSDKEIPVSRARAQITNLH